MLGINVSNTRMKDPRLLTTGPRGIPSTAGRKGKVVG